MSQRICCDAMRSVLLHDCGRFGYFAQAQRLICTLPVITSLKISMSDNLIITSMLK